MAEQKGKYQPWSHEEFMADIRVRRMPPTALKTYMMLLHEAFVCETRPNLPDDEEKLELMAYCTDHEEWLTVREAVLGMFSQELVDGIPVLIRKRLQDDWDRLQDIRESRSKSGKLGAEVRWGSKNGKSMANDSTLVAKNSKEVSKEVKEESKVREEPLDFSETDGQDVNIKPLKSSMTSLASRYHLPLGGYNSTWSEIKTLSDAYGSGALLSDFEEFLKEKQGDEFPKGVAVAYLYLAPYRLEANTVSETINAVKDPAVVDLARELAYVSAGEVVFGDKQKIRLAEVLKDFSADEIKRCFKTWLEDQDLSDPKNLSFLPGKFVQIVDSLCYASCRRKQETEAAKLVRDAAAKRLSEEAEADRAEREKKRLEEEANNPLADLFEL